MLNKNNTLLIAKLTFSEVIRGKIILVLSTISLLLLTVNILVPSLYSWGLGKVVIEFGLSVSALTGLLIIFFLALKILYNDLERHSFYFLFSRPVSKTDYIVGKYLGLAYVLCMTTLIIGAGTAISIKYVIVNYSPYFSPLFSWTTFGAALFFQALSFLVVLAIVFFWFSFITESFVALVLSLCSYQVCQSMELIRQLFIESYKGDKFDQVAFYVANIVSYILPNLSFFDLKSHAAYGLPISTTALCLYFVYGCSYIIVMLFFSSVLFAKRKSL